MPQLAAANALLAGGSHEEAAQAAGVHPVSVTGWANHHPALMAHVKQAKADAANRTTAKANRVSDLARDVVQAALEAGNYAVALKMASDRPPTRSGDEVGPSDPVDVVERVRVRLLTNLQVALPIDDRTTPEAEQAIRSRLP